MKCTFCGKEHPDDIKPGFKCECGAVYKIDKVKKEEKK